MVIYEEIVCDVYIIGELCLLCSGLYSFNIELVFGGIDVVSMKSYELVK